MKLPRGFREGHGGDLACPHRDCSCCTECATRPEVVEVFGQHFWVPEPAERATLRARVGEIRIARAVRSWL